MKKIIVLFALLLLKIGVFAQSFYNASAIQEIRIYFAQSNWDALLDTERAGADGYVQADSVRINGTTFNQVGVKYKGNSSYNVNQVKNPFHIELDTYLPQDYQGYTDIKLSNIKFDPSFVREALSYTILRQYMHAPKANFANVYVNNSLIGIYTNVESISKKFVSEKFGSNDKPFFDCSPPAGAGPQSTNLPNLVNLGPTESSYYSAYDMKSDSGWNHLIDLTNVLSNNIANIETVMDIDRALWMLAFDNVLVNLDSYLGQFKQNYYLYKDDNGRFNSIVWDLNMSFGTFNMTGTINLGSTTAKAQMTHLLHQNDAAWPLMQKLMAVPTYKRKYLAHFKTILMENFANGSYLTTAQMLQTLISSSVQADPNKFYTFTQFQSSINTDISVGMNNAAGLSNLMTARYNYLSALTDFTNTQPLIAGITPSSSSPALGSNVNISATITNTNSTAVYIGYRINSFQAFTKVTMYDDGAHNDGAAGDNVYAAIIPINNITTQYYIYAENNNIGRFSPERAEHEFHTLIATYPLIGTGDISINELMAQNSTTAMDEMGVYEDWTELYNNTSSALDLSGYFLSDDTANLSKWQFPLNTVLQPNSYLIVWCDDDATNGPYHTTFKLSALGESLTLSSPDQDIIDQVFFGPQTTDMGYARVPNGTGNFVIQSPTYNANNETSSSIVQTAKTIEINAFPNPSSGYLKVRISELLNNERISVYNQLGQMVLNEEANTEFELDLTGLNTGMYFLKYANITLKINLIN
jgi:hypothetical protein